MAEKRTSCKSFLAAHRGMAVLLAAELLCLLVLLARCFKPLYTRQLDFTQMTMDSAQENCAYSVQDSALIVDTTGAAEPEEKNAALLTLTSPAVILPSDAYEVIVNYDSDQLEQNEEPISMSFINQGMAEVLNGGTDRWGGVNRIKLDGSHYNVTGRIWVKQGNTKGFKMFVQAVMPARTEIYSITFVAKRAYRVIQLLTALLLCTVLDIFLLLFFVGHGKIALCLSNRGKALLLLAAVCLAACLPYTTGINYVGDDFPFHIERIAQVAAELQNGQFPVRMMTEMLNGYGYANSLYYCDVFLYLPAVLYNCMVPLGICYNIYGVMVTLCTCWLTYYSLRRISDFQAACVGTAVYLLSGYRLVNVFIRAAVGEYTAMAFLPLVAVHMYLLYVKEKTTWHEWVPLAAGMAGMLQCHVLTFELTCLVLGVFAIVFWKRTFSKEKLAALLKVAGTAVGLCAWFLVPFLQSMLTQNVQVNRTYAETFQENGTSLAFLLNPFPIAILQSLKQNWGGSEYRIAALSAINHGTRGTLGAPLLAGLLLSLYILFYREKWDRDKRAVPLRAMLLATCAVMLFSLRQFPWNCLFTRFENTVVHKFLGAVQFPWRWLSIAAALLSVCTVLALKELGKWNHQKAKMVGAALLLISFLYVGGFCVDTGAIPKDMLYTATNADSMMIAGGEYLLPGSPDLNYARPRTESADLQVKYYDKIDGVAYATLENTGAEPAALTLPIYDYGNYVVTDDTGAAWPTETSKDSLLEVSVPAGFAGGITVRYREPVLWRIMEIVSAATLAATVFGCLTQRQKEKTTAQQA